MTNDTRPETGPMLILDCPLCEGDAVFDEATDELDCTACGIRLSLAEDAASALPAAA